MSSSQPDSLLPHLPYLRRHARMLSGSSASGDEYVRICLEFLVAEPHRLGDGDTRVSLYKAFHQVWDAVCLHVQRLALEEFGEKAVGFEQHMQKLAPFERRILLLSAVEGFAVDDIAEILRINPATIEAGLAEAVRNTGQFTGREVLIIEDDIMTAEDIADVARSIGLKVVGPARTEDEATALFESHSPALILSDIQLEGDDSGIAIAWQILQDKNLPVIFVTGYPEAVLTGEGAEPAFVVAKPFTPESLRSTIGQVLDLYEMPDRAEQQGQQLFSHLDKIVNMEALAKMIADGPTGKAAVAGGS